MTAVFVLPVKANICLDSTLYTHIYMSIRVLLLRLMGLWLVIRDSKNHGSETSLCTCTWRCCICHWMAKGPGTGSRMTQSGCYVVDCILGTAWRVYTKWRKANGLKLFADERLLIGIFWASIAKWVPYPSFSSTCWLENRWISRSCCHGIIFCLNIGLTVLLSMDVLTVWLGWYERHCLYYMYSMQHQPQSTKRGKNIEISLLLFYWSSLISRIMLPSYISIVPMYCYSSVPLAN